MQNSSTIQRGGGGELPPIPDLQVTSTHCPCFLKEMAIKLKLNFNLAKGKRNYRETTVYTEDIALPVNERRPSAP